jgi:cytochrome c5
MEALVSSVKNGLGIMPPGGLCNGCSDDDYKALITYMSTPQ